MPKGRTTSKWYENGVRRRQSVPDPSSVLEHARRKAIELDASKSGNRNSGERSTNEITRPIRAEQQLSVEAGDREWSAAAQEADGGELSSQLAA